MCGSVFGLLLIMWLIRLLCIVRVVFMRSRFVFLRVWSSSLVFGRL